MKTMAVSWNDIPAPLALPVLAILEMKGERQAGETPLCARHVAGGR